MSALLFASSSAAWEWSSVAWDRSSREATLVGSEARGRGRGTGRIRGRS